MSAKRHILAGMVAGHSLRAAVPAEGLHVGRSHECGLTVEDPEASRLHCIVRESGDRVTVEDRSQNGTCVNGTRISAVTEIKPGDVIRIGTSELTLREEYLEAETVVAGPSRSSRPTEAEPSELKPGDMIDRYRIKRMIGKGGMGTVYEAVHTGLDLPRALKALTLPDDPAYAAFREKFLDEGKILARLRHENITQVHDAAYDEKTRTLFFAMDLVLYDDGKPCTLADVAYDECDVSSWFAALASALDYIHAQGIVHSDIKLQNVLVSAGQKIKLADFGVAHLLSGKMRSSLRGSDGPDAKETVGFTAHYVAPEVLKPGGMPSVASDVYALGVLLVRLLANKWYDENPTVLSEIAAKRSLNWRPILAQMLSADPKRRPTGLMKLVTELRRGSKSVVRRKYQIENRRRRSQKVRLQRVVNLTTGGIRPTALALEPKRNRFVPWAVLALAGLAGAIGLISTSSSRKAEEERLRIRLEALETARGVARMKVKSVRDALNVRAGQLKDELARHRREHVFVAALSQANVTGSTDRVTATLRNATIGKYADVLKAAGGVRTALAACRQTCGDCDARIDGCETPDAVQAVLDDFERTCRKKSDVFEAVCADESQKWIAYGESRARIEKETDSRRRISVARSRSVALVRQLLADEAALKDAPERIQAREKLAEGDGFANLSAGDSAAALRSYADAVACLSNGLARFKAEREERIAIGEMFRTSDDRLRNELLPDFRSGKSSLTEMVRQTTEMEEAFAGKWDAESTHPTNRDLVAVCALRLQAPAAYFRYLAKTLPGHRDGLTFALTSDGIAVDRGRFSYPLGWHDIFSSRRLDMQAKISFRRAILEVVDVPMKAKASVRCLLGRWIALKVLMPTRNTREQEDRLVEAVLKEEGVAALICARQELPERFSAPVPLVEKPSETVSQDEPTPSVTSEGDAAAAGTNGDETAETDGDGTSAAEISADAAVAPMSQDEFADFPTNAPSRDIDVSQERLILFSPEQGLSISAFGAEGVEIAQCARSQRPGFIRFAIANGEASMGGSGAWRSAVEVAEGQFFAVRCEALAGICRFTPVMWIDRALGDGTALVLIRCQYEGEGQDGR